MNIKNAIIGFGFGLLVVFIAAQMFSNRTSLSIGSSPMNDEIRGIATMASTTVGTSSTMIFATSTDGQVYRSIVNTGSTDVYLGIGAPAVSGKGIMLSASGGSFEMVGDTFFTAAIYGISSANDNVATLEK